jgi:ribA/ribD-fused uncharacterized protein
MPITFTKVKLPHGWMGNMAPFSVKYQGKEWRTTEALFQALRFDDDGIREEIRAITSPMGCKMRVKKIIKEQPEKRIVLPMSEQDLANMEMVLRLKLEQHPDLKQMLLDTGNETIIEDCTNRPRGSGKFWGAALEDGKWQGKNMLGKLWMRLRKELKRSRTKPKKHRQKIATKESSNGAIDALATIKQIKRMAEEVGGMKKLKALVDALSE